MKNQRIDFSNFNCPLPLDHSETILLAHGSGGRMTHDLIRNIFQPFFSPEPGLIGDDFAQVVNHPGELIVSTDSHIVKPLFFPGGDIGRLAVCGTVNDVAMSGAMPLFLTAGFILEEGLAVADLIKVLSSMKDACDEAGVRVIAGDTKVVERGKGDGLFINTTGFGWRPDHLQIHGANARSGDNILISGNIADHGMAIVSARGELGLSTDIQSDVAPLNGLIQGLIEVAPHIHVLRDPTRGGIATTLNEIALQSGIGIELSEDATPIAGQTASACSLLGFDPLYIANEGKVIIILPEDETAAALDFLHGHKYGRNAKKFGTVVSGHPGKVILRTSIGSSRQLPMLSGEMLPRIC